MIRANAIAVADALENQAVRGLGFSMATVRSAGEPDRDGHCCQVAACIAGWTMAVARAHTTADQFMRDTANPVEVAMEFLGLSAALAYRLFYPVQIDQITLAQAVATLRHFARTGQIRWDLAELA